MIIECDNCGRRYNLDSNRIPGASAYIKCPACSHRFEVYKPSSDPDALVDGQDFFNGNESRQEERSATPSESPSAPVTQSTVRILDLSKIEQYLEPIESGAKAVPESDSSAPIDLSLLGESRTKSRQEKSDEKSGKEQPSTQLETPSILPPSGKYDSAQWLSITCSTADAPIYFSIDGSEPDGNALRYVDPIELTASTTVKARAFKVGWKSSEIASETYDITQKVVPPSFSLKSGTYSSAQTLTISSLTPDASIRFTKDGSDPTMESPAHEYPIGITKSVTIRARAFRPGWRPSKVEMVIYEITGTVATPIFFAEPGVYSEFQMVNIFCATPGAEIHYTLDKNEPTRITTAYTGPIEISNSTILSARAFKEGWRSSELVTGFYEITGKVEAPIFSIEQGIYTAPEKLSVSSPTLDANIYYTIDGSLPTAESLLFSQPLEIRETTTITVGAFRDGWAPSEARAATYIITGKMALPVFSVKPGKYLTGQNVVLYCPTGGASIYYTIDGNIPTEDSILCSSPIHIEKSTIIKARAFRNDWEPSDVSEGDYQITGTVSPPLFSLAAGTYPSAQTLSVFCPTPEARVYYTLDGSEPTDKSTEFSGEIEIKKSTTVTARASKSDWESSDLVSAFFEITGTVAAPKFSVKPGTYPSSQNLTLTCETPNATLRYTTDGSIPAESSIPYSGPISMTKSANVKARAFRRDWEPSEVSEGAYVITGTVSPPTFSHQPGTYARSQVISIDCATPEVQIRYTLDGTEPTEESLEYSEEIEIKRSTTILARAYKTEWTRSDMVSAFYEITGTVSIPTLSVTPGIYTASQHLSITCETSDARIYYTADGREPSGDSILYTGSIYIARSATLKIRAFRKGWGPSKVVEADYKITGQVSPPLFLLSPGTYPSAQTLSLTCTTSDVEIRYTMDGTEPIETSLEYTGEIEIVDSITISTRAFRTDWEASEPVSADFIITGAVVSPQLSLAEGTYTTVQNLDVTCATQDVDIRYTTDGTEPTPASLLCSGLIIVDQSVTLSFKAFKSGWTPSETIKVEYEITGSAAPPKFSLQPGIYSSHQVLFISCATPGVEIRYTIDGGRPDLESLLYTEPVEIDESALISARAFRTHWEPSLTVSAKYEITGMVATPEFSLKPGIYTTSQSVSLECLTEGAEIFYTVDGSEPTPESILHEGPVPLTESTTISARAFIPDWVPSEVISASYIINRQVAAPTLSLAPGSYDTAQTLAVECATNEAQIFFTIDGTTPTRSALLYSDPLELTESVTLCFQAHKTGWIPSEPAWGVFDIIIPVSAPAIIEPVEEVTPLLRSETVSDLEPEKIDTSLLEAEEVSLLEVEEVSLLETGEVSAPESEETPLSETEEEILEVVELVPLPEIEKVAAREKTKAPSARKPSPRPAPVRKQPKRSIEKTEESSIPVIKGPFPDYFYILNEEHFEDGKRIIGERKHGDWFWVVLEGAVDVVRETAKGRMPVLRLGEGSYPGALAAVLSHQNVRTATILAKGETVLGVMDIQKISVNISSFSTQFQHLLDSIVTRIDQVTNLAEQFFLKIIPSDDDDLKSAEPLIEQDQKDPGLFKIQRGKAFVIRYEGRKRVCLATLGINDFFGQIPFLDFNHEPHGATVLGSKDIETIEMDTEAFNEEYNNTSVIVKNIIANAGESLSVTTKLALNFRNLLSDETG